MPRAGRGICGVSHGTCGGGRSVGASLHVGHRDILSTFKLVQSRVIKYRC